MNSISIDVEPLSKEELDSIKGGGIYMITECNPCTGITMRYFWNSETGECWNVIGNEDCPCC